MWKLTTVRGENEYKRWFENIESGWQVAIFREGRTEDDGETVKVWYRCHIKADSGSSSQEVAQTIGYTPLEAFQYARRQLHYTIKQLNQLRDYS